MVAKRYTRKKKKGNKWPLILALLLVCVVALIVYINFGKNDVYLLGVKVGGVDISGLTQEKAASKLSKTEEELLKQYSVTVVHGEHRQEITYEDIGASTNLGDTLSYALTLNKNSSEREFTLNVTYNEEKLRETVNKIAADFSAEAIEPKVESFNFDTREFVVLNGKNGYKADADALFTDIKNILDTKKSGNVAAKVDEVPSKVQNEHLKESFGKIAYFSTVCNNNENSEHNMRLSMQLMNKTIVNAGENISFNDTVGDSTTAQGGWVKSGAWINGELTEQYGGGLCQAATTLYNCALLANMEVVERFCHMQPSDYCEIGLDATIDYGNIDLIMKNTSDYPIYIISEMNGKTLEMKMYGYISEEYDSIKLLGWETGTTEMPEPEYEEDEQMQAGSYERVRKGFGGSTAQASRVWYNENGEEIKSEDLPSSEYSKVAPLYKVAPGLDVPKIPEGSASGYIEQETYAPIDDPSSGGITTHGPPDAPLG